jgi:hypothetical protein
MLKPRVQVLLCCRCRVSVALHDKNEAKLSPKTSTNEDAMWNGMVCYVYAVGSYVTFHIMSFKVLFVFINK